MTTLLAKLVIDNTALPDPEQANIMGFGIYRYTVVYPSATPFRLKLKTGVLLDSHSPGYTGSVRDRLPHPCGDQLLPSFE